MKKSPPIPVRAAASAAVLLLLLSATAAAQTPPQTCQAGRGGMVFSTGAEVTVEILQGNPAAIFQNEIRLLAPDARVIGSFREVGKTVNLGTFPAGAELVFGILVQDSIQPGTFTYSMGPGSRNPDGVAHADVACLEDGKKADVSFEDGFNGGDMGFNDVRFQVRLTPPKIKSVVFEQVEGDIDDNPADFGGGKRIFPDAAAAGGQPRRKVRVTARISSATKDVDVFLRSFDVDDASGLFDTGHGDDNLGPAARSDGIPQQGAFETNNTPKATFKTDDQGVARGILLVTMQPGDNFRVAAATKQEVVDRLTVDKMNIKDPSSGGRTLAEENAGAQDGDESVASKMLTVWRRMHVEVDSMPDPPPGDADPERNFIKGTVTGIRGGGSHADKLFLTPDATTPPLVLDDGSKNLSGSGQQKGKGRFEKGTITLGTGAAAVVVADVEGNGTDYVEKDNMTIPFRLVDSQGNNPIPANAADRESVTALDHAAKEFTISQGVRNVNYVGGTLTVLGVNFTVDAAQGRRITVREDISLPFHLVDDDATASPFLDNPPQGNGAQAGTPFEFMQTSPDKAKNPFAPAYILPVYDLGGGPRSRDFDRNVEHGTEVGRVSNWQDFTSSADFWVVYLQGALQGPVKSDVDPGAERGVLGETSAVINPNGSLSSIGGAAIYRESIRDIERFLGVAAGTCLKTTPPHETGHEWGLLDGSGGLMDQGCPKPNPQFTDDHLKHIRRRPHPQGL